MKIKVTLLENRLKEKVSLQQLVKLVIPNRKMYAQNLDKIMSTDFYDADSGDEIILDTPLELFRLIIQKGLLSDALKSNILQVKRTKGFKTNNEAVEYYLNADKDLLTILTHIVKNVVPTENVDKSIAKLGQQGSRQDVFNKSKKY